MPGFGGGAGERERERAELIYYLTYPQTFKYDKYFKHFFTLHFGTVDSLYIWTVDIVGYVFVL